MIVKIQPNSIELVTPDLLKTRAFVDYVDYCFLSKHNLLLPTRIECRASIASQESKLLADTQVLVKSASLKLGRFATHTFSTLVTSWQDVLSQVDRPIQPLTHFLVCNNTQESIRSSHKLIFFVFIFL